MPLRKCTQGIEKSDTWFGIALKVVQSLLKQKIISSPDDQTAVIFYGTVGSKSAGNHQLLTQPIVAAFRVPHFHDMHASMHTSNKVIDDGRPCTLQELKFQLTTQLTTR